MTRVVIQETGRLVFADEDTARRWIAQGYAVLAPPVTETASLTATPQPARRHGVETR